MRIAFWAALMAATLMPPSALSIEPGGRSIVVDVLVSDAAQGDLRHEFIIEVGTDFYRLRSSQSCYVNAQWTDLAIVFRPGQHRRAVTCDWSHRGTQAAWAKEQQSLTYASLLRIDGSMHEFSVSGTKTFVRQSVFWDGSTMEDIATATFHLVLIIQIHAAECVVLGLSGSRVEVMDHRWPDGQAHMDTPMRETYAALPGGGCRVGKDGPSP